MAEKGGAVFSSETSSSVNIVGCLFFATRAKIAGNVIYKGEGQIQSGYNAYEGSSYNFTFDGEGDTEIDSTSLPFLPRNFHLIHGPAVGIMPADQIPADYPTEDFYGNSMLGRDLSAGAVQQVAGATLKIESQGRGSVAIVGDNQPDSDSLFPVGSEVLLNFQGDDNNVLVYAVEVNGEKQVVNGNSLRIQMNTSKHVKVVFRRLREVENLNDAGAGSFRELLATAENLDSIVFPDQFYGKTLELRSELRIDSANRLSINGKSIILSGVNQYRILNITNRNAVVDISRVHFTKGRVDKEGGAIRNTGKLSIYSSIFSYNNSTSGHGGAIYSNSFLGLVANTFYSNTAKTYAGAVCADADLTANLFYRNTDGNHSLGSTMYGNYIYSNGYNAYDGPPHYKLNKTHDTLIDAEILPLSPTSYHLSYGPAVGLIPLNADLGNNYPKFDFYGQPTEGKVLNAGAVQGDARGSLLSYKSVGRGNISIVGGAQADEHGFYSSDSEVIFQINVQSSEVILYSLEVNGENINVDGETFKVKMNGSKFVKATFRRLRVVENLNDNGDGSLRSLLSNVEELDSIVFPDGSSGNIVYLDTELTIDKAVSISVNGNGIVLSGQNKVPILSVDNKDARVDLYRFHFTEGYADEDANNYGGAIYNNAKLRIFSSIFSHNNTAFHGLGGAIYNVGDSLHLVGNTFYANTTGREGDGKGGAIYNKSGRTFSTANLFYGNFGGSAGGIVFGSVVSRGYNIYEGDARTLFSHPNDKRIDNAMFFDTNTFDVLPEMISQLQILPDSFPEISIDYYGVERQYPSVVGAVSVFTSQLLATNAINNYISIYPNPVHRGGTIHIETGEEQTREVLLYDVLGKLVLRQFLSENASLQMPEQAGVYLLFVGGGSLPIKVVVRN